MAFKAIYTVVAVVGIAGASGAAWWYQNKPAKAVADVAGAPSGDAGSASGAARSGQAGRVGGVGAGPGSGAGAAGAAGRAPSVEVAQVQSIRIADDAQTVGSLRSRQSVVLKPEVSGRVTQLNFRDGEKVRRGQLLVQLDDQLPLAQLAQSQAELSISQANHKRNQELVAQNFISQRSVDESAANMQVAQAKLSLAQATAARMRILAPFDGVAGIRNVSVGDYLKDGADIVNIEDLDAILVDFRLPERFQTKAQRGQTALIELDALPGRKYAAVVQAIDPLVDANGRSIGLRACIDNRHMQLRPGMFARITAVFGEREDAKVIPEEAIVPQGGRQFVYRLVDGPDKETKTAQRVEVKVGIRQPGRVEIREGLQAGDTVVTAGQQRIQRDGMAVRVVELARAGAGAAPRANGPAGGGDTAGGSRGAASGASGASALAAARPAGRAASTPGILRKPETPRLAGANPCALPLAG